ncbi:hypothetical protein EOD40_13110 [Flavobacterium sufflavum]|uniref:Uncharacterized protein n=1 Tax=Flavobacterium sufflavum TaxID=1921138 RepID=A0A437KRB1_9FLAO|nr:hypothetical protein [Flavobacterium sufflavum]RVT74444.1 hypothetical protein EOD40_13110 [Flavobacterium sufflavum]
MERLYYSSSYQSYYYPPTLNYVTTSLEANQAQENTVNTVANNVFYSENLDEIHATYPLFFQNATTINIPKNIKRHIEKKIPKRYLNKIDKNKKYAVENCLLFSSNLTSTLFSEDRWKSLSSKILDEQFRKGKDNTFIYNHIVQALKYKSSTTDSVIQTKKNKLGTDTYQEGITCKSYSFTDTFSNNNLVKYTITNPEIIAKRDKFIYSQIAKATDNIIATNLLKLYPRIDLPNESELKIEANRLIKGKYRTKKGKLLTKLNNHSKDYFKDASQRSFVEENIKSFKFYTDISYMIPIIGDYKSGGRVVDSFSLMASWIRKLIKIDNEPIVEVDFKALHPNIAMSIYSGSKKFLTHQQVSEDSGIDIKKVKIEHLSFFNETLAGMKRSPLYQFYKESDHLMIKNIEIEKHNSKFKHRVTSMRMFAKEVEIMKESIGRLNTMGIYVGYIYDALFCKESEKEIVKKIMNEVVLELGVYTIAD